MWLFWKREKEREENKCCYRWHIGKVPEAMGKYKFVLPHSSMYFPIAIWRSFTTKQHFFFHPSGKTAALKFIFSLSLFLYSRHLYFPIAPCTFPLRFDDCLPQSKMFSFILQERPLLWSSFSLSLYFSLSLSQNGRKSISPSQSPSFGISLSSGIPAYSWAHSSSYKNNWL
jgi:hypothetical protein